MRPWALVLALMAAACAGRPAGPELPTVARVDLPRYMGTWHEIARYPHHFQEGCADSTATYRLEPDGTVDVLNECREPGGGLRRARGTARVVDPATNAKLEVSFFRPFWGDYWILALGDEYEYAVVGAPSREYLWVLAREPRLPDATYARLVERLVALGFDPVRLTRHDAGR